MWNFSLGVIASVIAAILGWGWVKVLWPYLHDRILYRGVRVDGVWDICQVRDGEKVVGKLTLRQQGSRLTGTSYRTETRDGQPSDRRFNYIGRIAKDQVTLLFEDARGWDFDTGSYIFRLHNDYQRMEGMATFDGKPENRIVAERRVLRKTAAPLPR